MTANAKNLSTLANVLDDGTNGQFLQSTGSGGIVFADVAAGASVYDSIGLLPMSGNDAGDMAYVNSTNRFYINNGSGWYSISLVNTNPNITSVQDAAAGTTPFTLTTDGTATVITITANDPEDIPLTYGYSVTSGSLTNGGGVTATVGQGTGEGYAISSASILSGTYTVSPYAGGLTFKPDGTEMYYVSTNNDRVSRHTLSTPWDVSTGSFVGSSPNTLTQVSQLTDVKFNNDGTKMYMADKAGTTDNTIYQYSLSSAWDPGTATYDNKSYDFTTQLTSDELNCFVFNNDGSAVYLAELGPSRDIFQYTLSTPFDISTASYANKSLSLASVASNGYIGRQYFQFTNDGSKLFLIHTFHPAGFVGKIYEYSLTTAYDISTASHTGVTYTPAGITTGRSAIAFKPDGSKMFIMGTDNHTTISQFNLPIYSDNQFTITPSSTEAYAGTFSLTFTASDGINTATSANSFTLEFISYYDIASVSGYTDRKTFATGVTGQTWGMWMNSDGTKWFVLRSTDIVYRYDLSTAYDISTASQHSTYNLNTGSGGVQTVPTSIFLKPDGTKLYSFSYITNDAIAEHTLSTAFDLSTASYTALSPSTAGQEASGQGLHFKSDGSKVYTTGFGSDKVHQYSLSTSWDISTLSYDNINISVPTDFPTSSAPRGVCFANNGTYMYVAEVSTGYARGILRWTLSTPWDISTATPDQHGGSPNGLSALARDLFITENGEYFITTMADTTNRIEQYKFKTAYNVNRPTKASDYTFINQSRFQFQFKPDGTKVWVGDAFSGYIETFDLSTAWDVSTMSAGTISSSLGTTRPDAMRVSPDGSKLYVSDNGNFFGQYDITTPWDVSTINLASKTVVSNVIGAGDSFTFSSDGLSLYSAPGGSTQTIYMYNLTTAWDASTASTTPDYTYTFPLIYQTTNVRFRYIRLGQNDTKVWLAVASQAYYAGIHQLSLSTPKDLSTATYDGALEITGQTTNIIPTDMDFSSDGSILYIMNRNSSAQPKLEQYNL